MKMRVVRWMPAALGLLMLPACPLADWFKEWFGYKKPYTQANMTEADSKQKKSATGSASEGPAVVTQDGEVAVSADQFQEHVNAVFQSQPGIEQVLASMGKGQLKQMYDQIANMLRDQHVMRQFVERNELDQTEDYQKNRKMLIDQVENQLANYAFSQHLWEQMPEMSDKEARTYYQKHQNESMFQRDPFIKQSGGVRAVAVVADSEKQAESIAEQARQSGDLKKAAREYEKADAFQELGIVSQQASKPHRNVVAKLHEINAGEVATATTDDGTVYVVRAVEQVAPTYADFENVKEEVKNVVQSQRFQEKYQEKLDELRKSYNIQVNDEIVDQFAEQKIGQ